MKSNTSQPFKRRLAILFLLLTLVLPGLSGTAYADDADEYDGSGYDWSGDGYDWSDEGEGGDNDGNDDGGDYDWSDGD